MFLTNIKNNLKSIIGNEDKPIAVFSALWPLARASKLPAEDLCREVLTIINEVADGRTVLMPAFAGGFKNGICNLDAEPSHTGALSEHFRVQPATRRSVCPFFSFAVSGNKADEIVALRPKDAWGAGSLYELIYNDNVKILTLGVHPTHCSFTHYAEWVMRDLISYRYSKEFFGNVIHEGKLFPLKINLFVRCLEPSVINDFTCLIDIYKQNGMKHQTVDGVSISSMDAKVKIDIIKEIMKKDPLSLVKNRHDFEGK
jgi:aminoglycoside N3'-acetyltransferase